MISRRHFHKMVLSAVPLSLARAAKLNSTIDGVHLGVQTYSYRELPMNGGIIDALINAITRNGLAECELFAQQAELPNLATNFWSDMDAKMRANVPLETIQKEYHDRASRPDVIKAREDLRKWRLQTPLSHFTNIRKKFDAAGIDIHVYNLSFNSSFTDAEIDRGFEQARAVGVNIISASTTQSMAKRLAPFAEKHKMYVSLHGHANLNDPEEFAAPQSFDKALALSKYFKINLDIGHFTAANFDPAEFIAKRHTDISHLHVKDRKRDGGPNTEWGQGDTNIKGVLQLLKSRKYPIPAYIEYEYLGKQDCVSEVQKCFDYAKKALS